MHTTIPRALSMAVCSGLMAVISLSAGSLDIPATDRGSGSIFLGSLQSRNEYLGEVFQAPSAGSILNDFSFYIDSAYGGTITASIYQWAGPSQIDNNLDTTSPWTWLDESPLFTGDGQLPTALGCNAPDPGSSNHCGGGIPPAVLTFTPNIAITPGSTYAFLAFISSDSNQYAYVNNNLQNVTSSATQIIIENGHLFLTRGYDSAFHVDTSDAAINAGTPEPSTWMLVLGAGSAALLGRRRLRKSSPGTPA